MRTALATAGVLVFTFGLTEAWRDTAHGTVLPMRPGTARGSFSVRDAGPVLVIRKVRRA